MQTSSLLRCGLVSVHKVALLRSQTSEKETGVGAEKEDTGAIATMIAAGVVREDTKDGHVQEMATRTDDTDTDETIATAGTTKQSLGNITAVASAQGQDLWTAKDIGVARRETGGRGMVIDAGIMIESQHRHSNTNVERRGHEDQGHPGE